MHDVNGNLTATPDKCARTACNNQHANCEHRQSRRLYCRPCARSINDHNPMPDGYPLITVPKRERVSEYAVNPHESTPLYFNRRMFGTIHVHPDGAYSTAYVLNADESMFASKTGHTRDEAICRLVDFLDSLTIAGLDNCVQIITYPF